jgi:SAM-dependent MidA family methyltransferase
VRERVHRFGPLPYDEVVELAVAHFYETGGQARRDFVTSPEVGPLFGAVVGRALDSWWVSLGRPDPYVVVEAGAGVGTLARDVLAAAPACSGALRYVLVERSEALRARHATMVPLELPGWVLGPRAAAGAGADSESDLDEPVVEPGVGPMFASLAELPAQRFTGVILANELLDNFSFGLLRRASAGWEEIRVADSSDGSGGSGGEGIVNFPVPASPDLSRLADRLAPDAPVGGWIPVQHAAQSWLASALSLVERGRVVLFDYADTTASLAQRPPEQWVRTYRGNGRGSDPLSDLGLQDVTCEVAVDQLSSVRPPTSDVAQADWLRAHGLDDLVVDARAAWTAAAAAPDLAALKARSRVSEAAALSDPSGLGAFRVLEWTLP